MKQTKIITFLIIITFLSFLFFLTKSIINNQIKSSSLQVNNKTNYEVTLKENNFFQEDTNYYVSKAIEEVIVNFDYELHNNQNILYSYKIEATLKGFTDNETKLVWMQNKVFDSQDNIQGKDIKIKKSYPLLYNYYNSYVKSFENTYNLKIDAFLEIKLTIKSNDQKIDTYTIVTIPLNAEVCEITIKEDKELLNNNNNYHDDYILTFIFLILFILLIIFKNKPHNILKEYKHSIIKITTKPNLENFNYIILNNLEDLFKVAIDNNTLIYNYQNNYYCLISNTIYLYSQ